MSDIAADIYIQQLSEEIEEPRNIPTLDDISNRLMLGCNTGNNFYIGQDDPLYQLKQDVKNISDSLVVFKNKLDYLTALVERLSDI